MTGPDELRQEIAALGGRAGALTAPSAPCATALSLAARPCGPALVPLPGRIRSVGENHWIVGIRRDPGPDPGFPGDFGPDNPRRYQLTNRHGARWFFGRTRTPPTSLIGQVDTARRPAPAGRESARWRSPRGISTYRVGSSSRDTRDPRASFLSRRRHPGAVRGVPAAPRDSRCSRSRARKHADTR